MSSSAKAPLAGRVVLITGANTGIGLATATALAAQGAQLFIACRSPEKASEAAAGIERASGNARITPLSLDLGDFASIRACARAFLERNLPLHLLINNAGLAGARGRTPSGFELAFGVNHVGHFLLTTLLLDRIQASAPARIVTLASKAHYRPPGIDWDAVRQPTKTRTALHEYGVSKLANVLFSAELARRLQGSGVTTYALHPGVVASDVWRSVPWPFRGLMKLGMLSPEKGAATSLHCATSDEAGRQTGLYYDECRVRQPSKVAQDPALAAELWRRSEEWVR
jgi:NAD(P)-dependent dehydrogenase (short-subunit alcohol dehydrogenase family)